MRRWWPLAVLAVVVGTGAWWDTGGQHWFAYQTGVYCGSTGQRYCYWSGFGSVLPWALFTMGGVFAGVLLFFRHVNCHTPGCPRVGRYPMAGGEFKVCGHHHPGWEGKHPTWEQICAAHHLYLGKQPGKG